LDPSTDAELASALSTIASTRPMSAWRRRGYALAAAVLIGSAVGIAMIGGRSSSEQRILGALAAGAGVVGLVVAAASVFNLDMFREKYPWVERLLFLRYLGRGTANDADLIGEDARTLTRLRAQARKHRRGIRELLEYVDEQVWCGEAVEVLVRRRLQAIDGEEPDETALRSYLAGLQERLRDWREAREELSDQFPNGARMLE